uniref:Uncharacterized protein n=1 Tax=Rhizophora mucronata TaxID=61149 RepID=A0A2P2PU62_RHIMU
MKKMGKELDQVSQRAVKVTVAERSCGLQKSSPACSRPASNCTALLIRLRSRNLLRG